MVRKIILFLLGVAILGGAIYVANNFIAQRKFPKPRERKQVTSIFTNTVKNIDIPINITTSGRLEARERLELFSEVQGLFQASAHTFKPGVWYKKGDLLLSIESAEHVANLRAQKSALYNQVVLLLPDLRLDFPESFAQWEKYVMEFDVEKPLQNFPTPLSDKEKLFITGKNIYTTYYNVKALEERLQKYKLYAPFTGVLTEALVTPGTLIRPGQKLGNLINPAVYELAIPISTAYADRVRKGQQVNVHDIEKKRFWTGKVIRINSLVDPNTQSIMAFIRLTGQDLREGMFLEADLAARQENNAFEIDRKLLVDNNQVFVVQDTILALEEVDPVYFKDNTVVVKGLENGTQILAKAISGAFAGMRVQVLEDLETLTKSQ